MPRDSTKPPTVPTVKELLGDIYTEAYEMSYPDIDPPYHPVGTRILVQLRTPGSFKILANGTKFWYPDESVDAEKFRTQTALVRSLGPAAFCNRATMEPWPEGKWCVPGQFIRCPQYGGDRIAVALKDEWNREALFMTMNDADVIGVIYGDPLVIKTLL